MRAPLLSLLFCMVTAASLLAGDLKPEEAGKHIGEKVTVRGTVVQAVYSKAKNDTKSVYLNFGGKYPDQIFQVVALSLRNPALLANGPGWLTELQGKEIAVTGTVELYEGKPQIILNTKEDVNPSPGK
ncbi:MAG: hypothetical protein P4L99_20110 [Chthoniobacter sp.]|nr:hypothetical protein [Chthoniobacter sp.]